LWLWCRLRWQLALCLIPSAQPWSVGAVHTFGCCAFRRVCADEDIDTILSTGKARTEAMNKEVSVCGVCVCVRARMRVCVLACCAAFAR
jgi:hypothetical protein